MKKIFSSFLLFFSSSLLISCNPDKSQEAEIAKLNEQIEDLTSQLAKADPEEIKKIKLEIRQKELQTIAEKQNQIDTLYIDLVKTKTEAECNKIKRQIEFIRQELTLITEQMITPTDMRERPMTCSTRGFVKSITPNVMSRPVTSTINGSKKPPGPR